MSTPSSIINICSGVKLNHEYKHSIYFDSLSSQLTYFQGKVVKTFSGYTYLRKEWDIKVNATMEEARTWTYLFFKNGSVNKTYFYFINSIEYISDSTVNLKLEMDVIQTYLKDFTLLDSFIERQHVASDNVGEWLVEENLETGELVTTATKDIPIKDLCILVQSSINPQTNAKVLSSNLDGVFSGLGIYAVNMELWKEWGSKLSILDGQGLSDAIITMWMYPKALVQLADGEAWGNEHITHELKGIGSISQHVERPSKLALDYVPRNKKLLSYPFNCLYADNNIGTSAIYRFEKFGDPSYCNFKVVGSLSPDGSVKVYPLNYNGEQHNFEEGLTLGGFPTCGWNQDIYKLWLAQNQSQNTLSYAMAGMQIAGSVATGMATGGVGMVLAGGGVVSGATTIAHLLAQQHDKSIQPPQAKGSHSASVNVVNGWQTITLKTKTVDNYHARIIDSFFDMFGYRINTVMTPNIHARENWTYIKTIDCNIAGNFNNDDLNKLVKIFDNGITFWVNGDQIGNYSLSNQTL